MAACGQLGNVRLRRELNARRFAAAEAADEWKEEEEGGQQQDNVHELAVAAASAAVALWLRPLWMRRRSDHARTSHGSISAFVGLVADEGKHADSTLSGESGRGHFQLADAMRQCEYGLACNSSDSLIIINACTLITTNQYEFSTHQRALPSYNHPPNNES